MLLVVAARPPPVVILLLGARKRGAHGTDWRIVKPAGVMCTSWRVSFVAVTACRLLGDKEMDV